MSFIKKMWDFLKIRKSLWLYPALFIITMFALIIVFSHGSDITPFIYRVFE